MRCSPCRAAGVGAPARRAGRSRRAARRPASDRRRASSRRRHRARIDSAAWTTPVRGGATSDHAPVGARRDRVDCTVLDAVDGDPEPVPVASPARPTRRGRGRRPRSRTWSHRRAQRSPSRRAALGPLARRARRRRRARAGWRARVKASSAVAITARDLDARAAPRRTAGPAARELGVERRRVEAGGGEVVRRRAASGRTAAWCGCRATSYSSSARRRRAIACVRSLAPRDELRDHRVVVDRHRRSRRRRRCRRGCRGRTAGAGA